MSDTDRGGQTGSEWASTTRDEIVGFANKIVETAREPMLVLDHDLRVVFANPAFYDAFKVEPAETEGRRIYDLGNRQWDIPRLRWLLDEVLPNDTRFENHRVEHVFDDIGYRAMVLNARRLDHVQLILLALEDMTEREAEVARRDETEARYRSLFEAIDAGFCILEMIFDKSGRAVDYRFVEANPAFERQSGLSDAVGRRIREFAPDLEDHWFERYGRVALTGEPMRVEGEVAPLGRWFDINAFRVGAPERRRVAVLFTDISARRRTDAALRESEERHRLILESALDYAIFTTDAEGLITDWPAGAQAVFGWTAGEAVGRDVAITFTAEDRAAGAPEQERAQAGETGHAPNVGWHVCKDGSRVFIEGSMRPLLNGEPGRPRGFLKVGRDVTERRRFEQALHESEERFRRFAEASSDVLWIRDAETMKMEYLNPAFERIYGQARARVLGEGVGAWSALIYPEDREGAVASLERVLDGERVTHEFRITRADGETRWIENTDFPVFNVNGRLQRIGGYGRDVTAEKHAVGHQRMLLAELQHRVRNTLAVVRSVARRTADTSEDVEAYAMHLDGRINALARTQSVLTRAPGAGVDLEEMISDELVAHAAEHGRITVAGPPVRLQPKAAETLGLAIHELATNAVKYGALASPDGRIAVTWRVADGGVLRLLLEWRESGVAVVSSGPRRRGFGMELIERTVPYELGAKATLTFEPGGVCATIELPLNAKTAALEPQESDGGADGQG